MMKILRLLLLFISLFYVPQLAKRHFKPPPLHADIPHNPKWDVAPAGDEVLRILKQPFFYLSRGEQSTVFESEDGKYVLKLFRYRPTLFPLLLRLKNRIHCKQRQDFHAKMEKTFHAAYLACTEAAPFTQAIYCHLNRTNNQLPIIELKARNVSFGRRTMKLPLDSYRFVIQRKVEPLKKALLAVKNDPEELKQRIDSLISLLIERSALHIRNSDPNLEPNFGFLDGRAVELDFGNYMKMAPNEENRKKEIEHYLSRLERWFEKNDPHSLDLCRTSTKNTLQQLYLCDTLP